MEKNVEVAILLDIYGELLTDKQRDVIDLYYNQDLSLGEITAHQQITRQGVRDSIKRGEEYLYELEDKLGLLKSRQQLQEDMLQIRRLAENIYHISDEYKYSAQLLQNARQIIELSGQHIQE